MAETLWKDCADWMVKCQVLAQNHRVTWPDAQLIDFARTLQDGSVLCQLLHVLKPGCLDLKKVNLRPEMSEFLCKSNVELFLEACQKQFGLTTQQLFEPRELCELSGFLSVLQTLSELSKALPVKARGFPSFPVVEPKDSVEYYNVDKYRNLEEVAGLVELFNRLIQMNCLSQRSAFSDNNVTALDTFDHQLDPGTTVAEAHIYEDLCYLKLPVRELPEPKDKREYCIRELHDTEKNYTEALDMIMEQFMRKMTPVMNSADLLLVFGNIEDLVACHKGFYADLRKACFSQSHVGRGMKEAFLNWRMKFTQYGRYCASLQKAQWHLDELCAKNENVDRAVKMCQNETNSGKFRLRDLLSVPMQRILKYHLLLRELKKHSTKTSIDDQEDLAAALDIMLDIAVYINEVKRDTEMIESIRKIEASINDHAVAENAHLTDYGRLLIDGQVRFRPHAARDPKTRHIFVFDRVMLIVKPVKNSYSFKNALNMADFSIDETAPTKPARNQWSHQWHIYSSEETGLCFTMAVKTDELRTKWIAAIKLALENLRPPGITESAPHNILYSTFDQPTLCSVCEKLLRGQFYQGYRCTKCEGAVHKECVPSFRECKPRVPDRSRRSVSSISSHRHSTAGQSNMPSVKPQPHPRAMSFGHFSSSGANQNIDRLSRSNSSANNGLGALAEHNGQENGADFRSPVSRSSTSTMSPTSPGTSFPFSPFSPSTSGSFVYKKEDQALVGFSWFGGQMDREKAEEILQRFPNGTFLVRISSKGDPYKAISVKYVKLPRMENCCVAMLLDFRYQDKIRHIKIFFSPDEEEFFLAPQKMFKSVPDVIAWYEKNSLNNSFQGMDTCLKTAYKKALLRQDSQGGMLARFHLCHVLRTFAFLGQKEDTPLPRSIARYDFSATSPNMLTIKVGDEVEIISRAGEQRGWWKGRCGGRVGYFPLSYVEEVQ